MYQAPIERQEETAPYNDTYYCIAFMYKLHGRQLLLPNGRFGRNRDQLIKRTGGNA